MENKVVTQEPIKLSIMKAACQQGNEGLFFINGDRTTG